MLFTVKLPDIPGFPPMEALLGAVVAALIFFCLAAMAFGPLIAVACEALGKARKRVFLIKAARQSAAMSLFFALIAYIALGGLVYWLLADSPDIFSGPFGKPLAALCAVCAVAFVLLLLYFSAWKQNGMPGFTHTLCGVLAWLAAAASFYGYQAFSHRYIYYLSRPVPLESLAAPEGDIPAVPLPEAGNAVLPPEGSVPAANPDDIFSFLDGFSVTELTDFFFAIPPESFFWPVMLHMLPLAIGTAGAFGAFWLLIRRKRNDFGRDYYAFALPYSAKWALCGTLLSLGTVFYAYSRAGEFMLPELSHPPSILLATLCCALPALACLLWLLLIRSETPLRHKPGIVIALFALLAGVSAQFLALNEIIPSP
ncbi:hypothetical protein LJC23_06080 [Desulfovibrio sp. OttesenSCG-928-I05]|nr:hypothetical protein [Desulfovibrio sp. OttesenSCG-928-I05]